MRFSNVGSLDRVIRLIVGAALVGLPFALDWELASPSSIAAMAVGVILIVTAVTTVCPIYGVFGLRTKPKA
ncbi:MAG: DUF2892 domain-containing protein [Parvularculaceae bacterium]